VFVRPHNVPHADGLLAGLGCVVDESGFRHRRRHREDQHRRVSGPQGMSSNPRAQVITAAGAGSAAAIAINADLVQRDVERAVARHVLAVSRAQPAAAMPNQRSPSMSFDRADAARSALSGAMPALMSACVVCGGRGWWRRSTWPCRSCPGSDLRPTSTGLLWIVDPYILVFGCLLVLAGALG